jgi:hypothetical protein
MTGFGFHLFTPPKTLATAPDPLPTDTHAARKTQRPSARSLVSS